ncbi:glycoside hydrolase family 3 C-terminal domain-containing protein [Alkaliflexus imshenetskii]|uniref:glycoside hydrolase family 3 C-terminal domain-containing protein n=1 Tax=Alkaliflexus imshenetskii TaxID=286730 RepID=UPI0004B1F139|nr:glycoside hydrolase family 3 C-terminal domain-containing protein [Alkaliflexus imshenetskii]
MPTKLQPIKTPVFLIVLVLCIMSCREQINAPTSHKFWDTNLSIDERVIDLILQLTIDEKISMLDYHSVAIERLGIPEYNWWNEALHGVARAGMATVFPQPIGLAATFDPQLIHTIADVIATEGRAKYNAARALDNTGQYMGLTYWSPNINIFRDPRWGRGQETFGEDPFLTAELGKAFVNGLQGSNPDYLKAAACAKHYVVHSGPEELRHVFNAEPPIKDFIETYLPAFEALVTQSNVAGVMCAYNRTYNSPCCGSPYLLKDILRNDWGFKGYLVSDCWALIDFHETHKVTANATESAALALNNTVNLNCGIVYRESLKSAVEQNLVSEEDIDSALATLLTVRFRLGLLDPYGKGPYDNIKPNVLNCEQHQKLAYQSALKSIVLLKNRNNTLPLSPNIKKIGVSGPMATNAEVLLGNYHGISKNLITMLEGVANVVNPGTMLQYRQGCLIDQPTKNPLNYAFSEFGNMDANIVVVGISGLLEGEEGESLLSETKGDRFDLKLPQSQIDFITTLRAQSDKPLVLVLTAGSPVILAEAEEAADAILLAWYPGEQGGQAVADIIFGKESPSGRLPISFPKSVDQLPDYHDYSMVDRTYRYATYDFLYPFGFGLYYTQFKYHNLVVEPIEMNLNQNAKVKVSITNTGNRKADEVVQLYLSNLNSKQRVPFQSLIGFKRISIDAGKTVQVEFDIAANNFETVFDNGSKAIEPGKFKVSIGGSSPVERSTQLGIAEPLSAIMTLKVNN